MPVSMRKSRQFRRNRSSDALLKRSVAAKGTTGPEYINSPRTTSKMVSRSVISRHRLTKKLSGTVAAGRDSRSVFDERFAHCFLNRSQCPLQRLVAVRLHKARHNLRQQPWPTRALDPVRWRRSNFVERRWRTGSSVSAALDFWKLIFPYALRRRHRNDPSSATRRTGRMDCKPRRHAGFAAAPG